MTLHLFDKEMLPDEEFYPGELAFLVEENHCRLLDGRRTKGIIEKYFPDSGMFRWRILNFEDQGKYWDLPAEQIKNFQFNKNSKRLQSYETNEIEEVISKYNKEMFIEAKEEKKKVSEVELELTKDTIINWLKTNSLFFKSEESLDFSVQEGPKLLQLDFKNYMELIGMKEEERITSELMVLNPNSGEWVKGLNITMAEMGLVSYRGKIPRTKEIFQGIGSKENRRKYLIHRLAFIRGYFELLGIQEVVLYRGMTGNEDWKTIHRSLLPCTFSLDVGKAFANFDDAGKFRIGYLLKMTCKIDKLFMTYLETENMNKQYKEAEAVLIYNDKIMI